MSRIGTFAKDIRLFTDKNLSVEARQKLVAKAARGILARAQEENFKALGRSTDHETFVDGRHNARLESVNLDHGKIVFTFDLFEPALAWIGEQLVQASPVLTGRYQRSHIMLADGIEVDPDGEIPNAEEYVFVNTVAYARKIEGGLSDQAPDGVYEEIAKAAAARFGNIANVRYTLRNISGGGTHLEQWASKHSAGARKPRRQFEKDTRNPAIAVTPR